MGKIFTLSEIQAIYISTVNILSLSLSQVNKILGSENFTRWLGRNGVSGHKGAGGHKQE